LCARVGHRRERLSEPELQDGIGGGERMLQQLLHLGEPPLLEQVLRVARERCRRGEGLLGCRRRADLLPGTPDLAAVRLLTRADVRQESSGRPGEADPETIVLRQQRGMRRARQVDTVQAALVGACDGDLAPGQILGAVTSLLDLPPVPVGEQAGLVRELLADLSPEQRVEKE